MLFLFCSDFNSDDQIDAEDIEIITNRLISNEEEEMFITREEMDIFSEQVSFKLLQNMFYNLLFVIS